MHGDWYRTVMRHSTATIFYPLRFLLTAWRFVGRLLASLGAVESGSDRPHDFFDWLAAVGADAAASGRLRLFQLTHRGAAFCLLADGRDGRRPALHVFDPLGCTLHAANKRAYAVTFVGAALPASGTCACPC